MDDGESVDVTASFHNVFVDYLLVLLLPPVVILVFTLKPNLIEHFGMLEWFGFVGTQILIFLALYTYVGFMALHARYSDAGRECSGDYYTKDDEPEPYLWYSGTIIARIGNTFMKFLFGVAVCLIIFTIIFFKER